MKKLNNILTFAAAAFITLSALTSCQQQKHDSVSESGTKNISIRLNFGSTDTKAVDLETPWQNDYANVKSIQIYFTDGADNIRYAWEGSAAGSGDAATIWEISPADPAVRAAYAS